MTIGLMIDDFEYVDRHGLSRMYWTNAPGDNELAISLMDGSMAVSGKYALEMSYTINHSDPPKDYVGIESKERAPMDWRGYTSLCLWVQNQDNYDGALVIQFRELDGETWKCAIALRNVKSQEVCAPLTEAGLALADHSAHRNEMVDLEAIDSIAFYLGQGGRAHGDVYLDGVHLKP